MQIYNYYIQGAFSYLKERLMRWITMPSFSKKSLQLFTIQKPP